MSSLSDDLALSDEEQIQDVEPQNSPQDSGLESSPNQAMESDSPSQDSPQNSPQDLGLGSSPDQAMESDSPIDSLQDSDLGSSPDQAMESDISVEDIFTEML